MNKAKHKSRRAKGDGTIFQNKKVDKLRDILRRDKKQKKVSANFLQMAENSFLNTNLMTLSKMDGTHFFNNIYL